VISLNFADELIKKVKKIVNKDSKEETNIKSSDSNDDIVIKTNEQEMLSLILKKITDMNNEINSRVTQVEARLNDLEMKVENKDEINNIKDNIQKVQTTLGEFGKFYELVCRQYDPFVEEKEATIKDEKQNSNKSPIKNNKQKEEENREEKEVKTIIEDARQHIKDGNVKEAQKEYKKIMLFYKSINEQKLKMKIYKEAVKILSDINSMK
jgi:TolA-binding protein